MYKVRMDLTPYRDYHWQLCYKEKYTPEGTHFHVYIRNLMYTVPLVNSQLQGRNIHPGTWHSVYIRMGSTRCSAAISLAAWPQGSIHPGTHSPCIYQNGIYTVQGQTTTSSFSARKGEIYTQGHGIPPCISEWDLTRPALRLTTQQLVATREKYTPGTWFHGQNGIYT
jgi:hypothetical protein